MSNRKLFPYMHTFHKCNQYKGLIKLLFNLCSISNYSALSGVQQSFQIGPRCSHLPSRGTSGCPCLTQRTRGTGSAATPQGRKTVVFSGTSRGVSSATSISGATVGRGGERQLVRNIHYLDIGLEMTSGRNGSECTKMHSEL